MEEIITPNAPSPSTRPTALPSGRRDERLVLGEDTSSGGGRRRARGTGTEEKNRYMGSRARSEEIDAPSEQSARLGLRATMDHDLRGYEDDDRWVAVAAPLEALATPERPRTRPRNKEALRALVLAILGVVCLGFVFGPLALGLGRQARLRLVTEPSYRDAGIAHAAVTIGKVGLALHLTIVITVLPWLLFMLPRLRDAAG